MRSIIIIIHFRKNVKRSLFFYENLTESGNRNEAVSWKGMSLTGCWKRVFRMASAYLRCMRISDMRSMENYLILFPVFGLFAVGGKETLLFHAGCNAFGQEFET